MLGPRDTKAQRILNFVVVPATRQRYHPNVAILLYSDLLLRNMGPALNDGFVQGNATGAEWRTTPLWGLRLRARFLHDGRAATPAEAILSHEGDGAAAAHAFRKLTHDDRNALLVFMSTL